MHRHGYKGRKFGRERDERKALIRGLATALVEHHQIETTLPKAKELRPYAEKLITKAKKGGLHNRRQVISKLDTLTSAHKLTDEIAPQLSKRESGYLRITRTSLRKGDNTQMAKISFVDSLKVSNEDTSASKATHKDNKAVETHVKEKKSAIKTDDAVATIPSATAKASNKVKTATRRTGVRGNK